MSRPVKASASDHPVERAIAEGKFPESRRGHYMALMAKNPKKTKRLIAKLEAVLEPPEVQARRELVEGNDSYVYADGSGQAAPVGAAASGPTAYPQEWLAATAAGQPGQPSGRDPITMENPIVAAQCIPGANIPAEGLG